MDPSSVTPPTSSSADRDPNSNNTTTTADKSDDNAIGFFCANPGDADTGLGRAAEGAGWLIGQAGHLLRAQLPDFSFDSISRFVTADTWAQRLQILTTPVATDPYTLQRLVRSLCGDYFVNSEGTTAIIRGFDTFIRASVQVRARGERTAELFFRASPGSAFPGEPKKYGVCPYGVWDDLKDIEPHVVAVPVYTEQVKDIGRMIDESLAEHVKSGKEVEAGVLFRKLIWDILVFTSYGAHPGEEVTKLFETFENQTPAFDRSLRVTGSATRAGKWDEELQQQQKFMWDWSNATVAARKAAIERGTVDDGQGGTIETSSLTDVLTYVLINHPPNDIAQMTGALHGVFLAGYNNLHSAVTGAVVKNVLQDDAIATYMNSNDGETDMATKTDFVVRETLRMHTAIPVTRTVQKEDEFSLGDTKLAPGGTVILSTYGVNTDPKTWEDADEFRPQRFEETAIDEIGFMCQKGFAPFGAAAEKGGRQCSGRFYMTHLLKTVIGKLMREYKIEAGNSWNKGYFDFKQTGGSSMYIGKCEVRVLKRE